ncbi:hypothetical protein V0M98_33795 (plasmid) [Pseudomonas silesiensis]|uniref:hypothetical protein n=1 Tax=Pseudomonas silesiensis TaxID=1853130 RepID=UPI0030D192A7
MIPKTLSQCNDANYELDKIKELHELALRLKDKPGIHWDGALGATICSMSFIAPVFFLTYINWHPELATPFTPFTLYVLIGAASAICTGFLAYKSIKFLTRNIPTWLMKFEETLSRYVPIDLAAFQGFQLCAKSKGVIEKADFEKWFDAERRALSAHVDELVVMESNVNLRSDGPFLKRPIQQ